MAECLLPSSNKNAMPIKIINFFISKGLTPNQALGICANVFQESSYNPTARNKKSGAYGLFQWLGSRRTALVNFCNKKGLNVTSADAQLAFCWHENDRNVWSKYASNRNMTAMQSLIYWEQKWERCGDAKNGCHRSRRVSELNRLIEMYKNSQKSSDCSVTLGSNKVSNDGSDISSSDPCDFTSSAYEENGVGDSGVKRTEDTYQPTGANTKNNKPVLFGGSWAYKMSPYFTGNGEYLAYTAWGGSTNGLPAMGDISSFMGTFVDRLDTSAKKSTIDHIRNYMTHNTNKPGHIVVTIDNPTVTYKKNGTKDDMINAYKKACLKFFGDINGCCYTKIVVPLRVDSWSNTIKMGSVTLDYNDINKAIKQAAASFSNVKTVVVTGINKGSTKPSNGILPENEWRRYSEAVKNYCRKL